jgi:UrcA family protein
MMKTSLKLTAGLLIAAAILSPSAQAKEFSVSYSKAELATASGASQVYHRIYDQAEKLCDLEFKQFSSSKTKLRYQRCLRRTVKEFVWQVDHPNVDKAYAALPVRRLKDRPVKTAELAKSIGR